MEERIFSTGKSIRQRLLNKVSRRERWHPGNVDPFLARGGYLGLGYNIKLVGRADWASPIIVFSRMRPVG